MPILKISHQYFVYQALTFELNAEAIEILEKRRVTELVSLKLWK
jgi:hypothetical protein